MNTLIIRGGIPLNGTIKTAGSKNSALPILASSILVEKMTISNIPNLKDTTSMLALLRNLNCNICFKNNLIEIDASKINNIEADYDTVRAMRASILVLGPLLAKYGRANIALPGGCDIGGRPIDLHLEGLSKMGAIVELDNGYVKTSCSSRLKGIDFTFKEASVTATENLMMAATLADGETILRNCAIEPEIYDLGECLLKMGSKISGHGTKTIHIQGVPSLKDIEYAPMSDRIESATYLLMGVATRGRVTVSNMEAEWLKSFLDTLSETGAQIDIDKKAKTITASAIDREIRGTNISTDIFPGFPTDIQPQFTSLLAVAEGTSIVNETLFENRMMHCYELKRMGADIKVNNNQAVITGVPFLKGAEITATNLRNAASLVIAGLTARGDTIINDVEHLYRGYENVLEKLRGLNADIQIL